MLFRRIEREKRMSSLALMLLALLAGCGGPAPVETTADDELMDELLNGGLRFNFSKVSLAPGR